MIWLIHHFARANYVLSPGSPQYCERCGKDDDDYPMVTLASDPTKHAAFEAAAVSIVRESSCAALHEVSSISIIDVAGRVQHKTVSAPHGDVEVTIHHALDADMSAECHAFLVGAFNDAYELVYDQPGMSNEFSNYDSTEEDDAALGSRYWKIYSWQFRPEWVSYCTYLKRLLL